MIVFLIFENFILKLSKWKKSQNLYERLVCDKCIRLFHYTSPKEHKFIICIVDIFSANYCCYLTAPSWI